MSYGLPGDDPYYISPEEEAALLARTCCRCGETVTEDAWYFEHATNDCVPSDSV